MTSRDTFHPFADSGGITMQEKSEGLNVARLRELEAAATPGPWRHSGSAVCRGDQAVAVTGSGFTHVERVDARLIAAVRNELVPLLDRLEAAEAKVAKVEALRLRVATWHNTEHERVFTRRVGPEVRDVLKRIHDRLAEALAGDPR